MHGLGEERQGGCRAGQVPDNGFGVAASGCRFGIGSQPEKRERAGYAIVAPNVETHAQSSRLAEFGGLECPSITARLIPRCRLCRIAFPRRLLNDSGCLGETSVMSELSPEQAREKCHKHLLAGLRLIRPADRVGAIAKAMQELEVRENRRRQSAEPDARH
jgi:hypothetical protein